MLFLHPVNNVLCAVPYEYHAQRVDPFGAAELAEQAERRGDGEGDRG